MNDKKDFILRPGLNVDLVFNLDSDSPTSEPSIVYESDYKANRIIIAQLSHRIFPGSGYRQLHISSLHEKESKTKIRMGFPCKILKIINDYRFYDQSKGEALLIEYVPDLVEINIRTAFRLHPNMYYDVIGKLNIGDNMFYSGRHFKFHDISNNGVGLLIPKKIIKTPNPMLDLSANLTGAIGLYLKISDDPEQSFTMECEIKVIRVNMNFNSLSGFAGCYLMNLPKDQESILNRFIHQAQLYDIRRMKRL